jgi:hypothetical protein
MGEAPPIPCFNLNHPKNYLGYVLAVELEALDPERSVYDLLRTNDEHGNRITRDVEGAADGAHELGLVSETATGEAVTERGQRVVSHAVDIHGNERSALAAWRELFGRGTRFIGVYPDWALGLREMLLAHDGIARLVELVADVHASQPEATALPLPLLVQELYHRDPGFAVACFIVPEARDRLNHITWGERGADIETVPEALWDRPIYRTSIVHQVKTLLWHSGVLTTKGTDRASLEFSVDVDKFLWGLTTEVRDAVATTTNPPLTDAGGPFDFEERVRDAAPPQRVRTTTSRIIRNTAIVKNLKNEHGYRCQICDEQRRRSQPAKYAEGHHLHPLGEGGPDTRENILIVCPTCHADLDYGMLSIDPDTLRVRHGYDEGRDGVQLRTIPSHDVGRAYLEYHNERAVAPLDE